MERAMLQESERIEFRFTDLRRLIELWAAWYSIGVDGWLASDESSHTCSLDVLDLSGANGKISNTPPYPPDPEMDRLLLCAINRLGLQCSRRGMLSFSHTGSSEEFSKVGDPLVALLETEQRFFSGKLLSLFSELRRDYGDFGSHTMALELTVQDQHAVILHASFEMNNRRRGMKLELWETISSALLAYEEIFEQAAALGHNLTGALPDDGAPESQAKESAAAGGESHPEAPLAPDGGEKDQETSDESEGSDKLTGMTGFPFPCASQTEASHLARLSNQVAPTRRAAADGTILTSTHSLRELAALVTFARFCEPMGAMQRI